MKKEPIAFLQEILESIDHIAAHVGDMTENEFTAATKEQDAVLRRFQVMGEAATAPENSIADRERSIKGKVNLSGTSDGARFFAKMQGIFKPI